MASSMTGFGRAVAEADGREITVELKSVNHRYFDPSFRMPRIVGFIEDSLRTRLKELIARGHVDAYINYRNNRSDARRVEIDEALLGAYLESARAAGDKFGLCDDLTLSAALKLPDVSNVVEADEDRDAVSALALKALDMAVAQLKKARADEGERLCGDLLSKLDTLTALRAEIEKHAPLVVEEYQKKLNERIEAMLGSAEVDRARLATEVALFADRASIDEELVRLSSHFIKMRELLSSNEPVGRSLDFVVQEMNREFNTIGSKANDADIAKNVIAAKAEMEKIREQVQNIE